eukprot:scaffold692_cov118-Cylindrotheca_fusiformis.AAC.17
MKWNYPMFFGQKGGLRFVQMNGVGFRDPKVRQVQKTLSRQLPSDSLVLASEYLHHRGCLNGKAFEAFANWTNISTPEIVINSRRPTASHMISLWKEMTNPRNRFWPNWSFYRYVCSRKTKMERKLGLGLNTIGMAYDMVFTHKLPTHFIEMSGVAARGIDISHAFACSVLKVQCTDDNRWVKGLQNVTIRENSKSKDPNINSTQRSQIEELFLQRDCAYGKDLIEHPLFHHLYEHNESWPQTCSNVQAVPEYRHKPVVMLKELRRIMECPSLDDHRDVETASNRLVEEEQEQESSTEANDADAAQDSPDTVSMDLIAKARAAMDLTLHDDDYVPEGASNPMQKNMNDLSTESIQSDLFLLRVVVWLAVVFVVVRLRLRRKIKTRRE